MKPHRKQGRALFEFERDDELSERSGPGKRRRRDPLRHQASGYYTEFWDSRRGAWSVGAYFRDCDSMHRAFRAPRLAWDGRHRRMRYPGDGKSNAPPEIVRLARPLELRDTTDRLDRLDRTQPGFEKFRDRISEAIKTGVHVKLVYRDRNGIKTVRTVRPLRWVEGDRFTAYCELRGDERDFCVRRLLDCQAAKG